MAINERDFYASHGISLDIEKVQIEYTKRVIRQAKIEVLTELQLEIDELQGKYSPYYDEASQHTSELIQQKIDSLKED